MVHAWYGYFMILCLCQKSPVGRTNASDHFLVLFLHFSSSMRIGRGGVLLRVILFPTADAMWRSLAGTRAASSKPSLERSHVCVTDAEEEEEETVGTPIQQR